MILEGKYEHDSTKHQVFPIQAAPKRFSSPCQAAAVAQAVSQMTQPGALGAQDYDSDELGWLWMTRCSEGLRYGAVALGGNRAYPWTHRGTGTAEVLRGRGSNSRMSAAAIAAKKDSLYGAFSKAVCPFPFYPKPWALPAFFWCFFFLRYLKFVCETAILGARISSNGHWLGARALRKENSDSDPSGSSHLWSMAVHRYQVVIFWLLLLVSVTGLSGLMLPQLRIWVRNSLGWMLSAKPLAPEPFMPDLGLQWASIPKFPSLPITTKGVGRYWRILPTYRGPFHLGDWLHLEYLPRRGGLPDRMELWWQLQWSHQHWYF